MLPLSLVDHYFPSLNVVNRAHLQICFLFFFSFRFVRVVFVFLLFETGVTHIQVFPVYVCMNAKDVKEKSTKHFECCVEHI